LQQKESQLPLRMLYFLNFLILLRNVSHNLIPMFNTHFYTSYAQLNMEIQALVLKINVQLTGLLLPYAIGRNDY